MKYSELRQAKRISLRDAVPLPGPLSIYVEPTNICNFKCVFCPESFDNFKEITGGYASLTPEDFSGIADQIGMFGTVKTINFYMMGEPFANKHLFDLIEIAKKKSICEKIIVTSNGSLISAEKYQRVCEGGLDYLRISIYGPNQEAHKKNTQSGVKLSRIIQNISGLKKFRDENNLQGPFIYVKMIESQVPGENDEFLEVFSDMGDEVAIEPVMNWNNPEQGWLANISEEKLLDTAYFGMKKHVCPFPFYSLVIHSDMRVSVCCVDWDKKTLIGDLKENSLEEIWHGDALREFQMKHLQRKRHELEGCRNCTYLHTTPDSLEDLSEDEYLKRLEAK